jgi:hypothetical protein
VSTASSLRAYGAPAAAIAEIAGHRIALTSINPAIGAAVVAAPVATDSDSDDTGKSDDEEKEEEEDKEEEE